MTSSAAGVPVAGADPRRELAIAVIACAVGAALALLAASRVWATEISRRPAPLPAVTVTHSGGALLPWLPALALVGLAGAGALLATRGGARSVVGVVIAVVGLGVVAAGVTGIGRVTGGRDLWPALVIAGGLGVAWAGVRATYRGRHWPAMGARYQRAAANLAAPPAGAATSATDRNGVRADVPSAPPVRDAAGPPVRGAATRRATGDAAMWDNLDRGIDPTSDED